MSAIKILPPQKILQDCFAYDPGTGILTWKERPLSHFKNEQYMRIFNTSHAGTKAGNLMQNGYLRIKLSQTDYLVHRIIYKFVTGLEPPIMLDHDNNIRTDNRFSNLRTADHNQNMHNRKKTKNNTSGFKGVYEYKTCRNKNKFTADIRVNNIRHYLGIFSTPKEAHEAYCKAATKYHGEFSNFG